MKNDTSTKKIAALLNKKMTQLKITTPKELGLKCGVCQIKVRYWLAGTTRPTISEDFIKLCRFLKITPSQIFDTVLKK